MRYLVLLLLLGSCTNVQVVPEQGGTLPAKNLTQIFKDCEENAAQSFPVQKRIVPKGVPEPTIVCKLGESIKCDERSVQTTLEIDGNERPRKDQMLACLRAKLN